MEATEPQESLHETSGFHGTWFKNQ